MLLVLRGRSTSYTLALLLHSQLLDPPVATNGTADASIEPREVAVGFEACNFHAVSHRKGSRKAIYAVSPFIKGDFR